MLDSTKKALINLANSGMWEIIRDDFLTEELNNIKDVTTPIGVTEKNVVLTVENIYAAKLLAAKRLSKIINVINRCVDRKEGVSAPEDYT